MWSWGLKNELLKWNMRLILRLTFTSVIGAWARRKSGKRVKFSSCPIVPQPHGPFCSHTALAQLCSLRLFRLLSIWWEQCYSAGSTLQLGQVIPCIPALSADNSGRASWSSLNFANFVFAFCARVSCHKTHTQLSTHQYFFIICGWVLLLYLSVVWILSLTVFLFQGSSFQAVAIIRITISFSSPLTQDC